MKLIAALCAALIAPAFASAQNAIYTKPGDIVQLRALDTITGEL